MKKYIALLTLFLFYGTIDAQINISGKVTDNYNEALPGVVVTIRGTGTGTITDQDGKYEIRGKEGDILEFSLVGMIKQAVTVAKKSTINIKMIDEVINLREVVAIGYGSMKKSDLTGSVVSIKPDDLANAKIGTVTSAMQGLATGVYVKTGSVKPGGDATIVIRGSGSLRAGSTPLYIVDGVPVQDGLQDLSSADIESIEILKDASAASIYGSRGSNGVVLVTTKRGTTDRTRVRFNATLGTQKMLNKQDLMNAQQYYELVSMAQPSYQWTSEELRLLSRGESTDWQDAITQDGSYQNYNIGISGGSEKLSHYLGIDWYDQQGTLKKSSFDKLTVRYNADAQASEIFKYGIRFNVIESKLKNINEEADSSYGTMFSAISSQPTAPIFTQDGEYYDGFLNTKANPVAVVDLLDRVTHKSRIVGSVYLEAEPIENLVLRSDNGGELVFYRVNTFEDGRMGQHYTEGGRAVVMTNKKKHWQTENTATYNFDLDDKTHIFTIMGGFSASSTDYSEVTAESRNLSSILKYNHLYGAEEHGPNSSYAVPSTLVSFYGRANYNYKDRYLTTFTMRADASSRFAPGHRWGYFPSLAFAWRASEENFIKNNVEVISNLKLRVSAGRLGNQNIGDFQYMARVGLGGASGNYIFGDNLVTGTVQTSVRNDILTWEKANQLDFGIDFGLFNNRVAGTIETYYKRTTDLLWEVPMPIESGFTRRLANIGKIDNLGIEFSVNTVNIALKDFQWSTGLMISFNKNEIKELYGGKQDVNKQLFVGRPIDQIYLLKSSGIWQSNEAAQAAIYNAQPGDRKVLDLKKDDVINGDDRDFCGVSTPKFYGSFNNTMNLKNFDLTAFFTFAGGHMINNSLNRYLNAFNPWGNMSENYYKYYWRPEQPNNKYPAPRVGSPFANGDGTDANLQKGDYLRLRNLELGYTLPSKYTNKVKISNARLFFSVQNLFTITEFTGFDVESNDNTNPYPNSRSFIGGISLNF